MLPLILYIVCTGMHKLHKHDVQSKSHALGQKTGVHTFINLPQCFSIFDILFDGCYGAHKERGCSPISAIVFDTGWEEPVQDSLLLDGSVSKEE